MVLGQLGQVAHAQGEYGEAARLFQESLALVQEIGEAWSTLQALHGLGVVTLALGEYETSRSAFWQELSLAREMQAWPEAMNALAGLANWLTHKKELEAALSQIVLVLNHSATNQETKDRAAQPYTELETRLTPQQIEVAHASAAAQPFEAMVEKVLAYRTG